MTTNLPVPVKPTAKGQFPQLERPGFYQVTLGNSSMFRIGLMDTDCGLLVAVVGRGSYEFSIPPDSGYVAEKLKIPAHHRGDAENLADFIFDQLGGEGNDRVGTYLPGSCAKEGEA